MHFNLVWLFSLLLGQRLPTSNCITGSLFSQPYSIQSVSAQEVVLWKTVKFTTGSFRLLLFQQQCWKGRQEIQHHLSFCSEIPKQEEKKKQAVELGYYKNKIQIRQQCFHTAIRAKRHLVHKVPYLPGSKLHPLHTYCGLHGGKTAADTLEQISTEWLLRFPKQRTSFKVNRTHPQASF